MLSHDVRKGEVSVYCHKCGAQNDDQAAFCDKCGVALQKPSPEAATTTPMSAAAVQYAGFWRRVLASIIDGLIVGAAWSAIYYTLVAAGVVNMPEVNETDIEPYIRWMIRYMLVSNAVVFALQTVYFALMESSSRQATLGKMALGIVVTDMDGKRISFGRAVGRNLGKIISQIILFIGFLMVAFTQKKQGLHDIIANCLVVVKK
jgi:uncharacterized RDD family membrane protein YckC